MTPTEAAALTPAQYHAFVRHMDQERRAIERAQRSKR